MTSDEITNMIKKDLLKMYKVSASKLNIDILKLDSYSLEQLYDIKNKYIELIKKNIQYQKNDLLKIENKNRKKQEKLNTLFENLQHELLPFDKILDSFLEKMEKYISESQSIFKDDYYLRKSVFVINHDIAGYPIKPFSVDKITIKYKDQTTNKDIIIYRENKTERYYDIYTLAYIGYKEIGSTNFVEIKNSKFLIIKYSLVDKIKYLGLYKKYVNILPLDKQLTYENKFRGDILYTNDELINQTIQNKVSHDKILIEKFQRIIYTIRNNKNKKSESDAKEVTKESKLIDEFRLRLQNITILSESFVLFLQNWKNVCSSYKYIPQTISVTNNSNNNYIDSDTIAENNNYNILIKYLLLQLIHLIDMNNDKTNINLCSLIALIFDLMWEEYAPVNNYELNKFLLILYSETEENIGSSLDVEDDSGKLAPEEFEKLSDDQKEKIKDAQEDFKEENEAIDVEGMDEDEKDLGEDSLASMMNDNDNPE
jgi:hypothetical protein